MTGTCDASAEVSCLRQHGAVRCVNRSMSRSRKVRNGDGGGGARVSAWKAVAAAHAGEGGAGRKARRAKGKEAKYQWRGSNPRSQACEACVLTTRRH